ncbi:hypothetical protein ACH518_09625 [Methylomonas sp. HW2-6]|uniref:hypothetical protein n=1 Tax=Methylomonas sp. HW2-6 TaxID=3376687 RepID=UPI0040428F7D
MSNTKYVRINPRTQLTTRHRAGIGFSQTWKQVDVDAATLEAIEEDPYLEVTDHPTVLVELPAVSQIGAIEAGQEPNNTPESTATDEGSTGETAAEGTDTGTASPVANAADAETGNENPTETGPEADGSEGLTTGDEIKTGDDAPVADAADAETGNENPTETGPEADGSEGLTTGDEIKTGDDAPVADAADAGADGTAATDGEQPANTAEKTAAELRIEQIKGAIEVLNPNVAENWLGDGRPATKAIDLILGAPLSPVSAAERDAIWAEIQSARSAG